jgi:hypothetical protein
MKFESIFPRICFAPEGDGTSGGVSPASGASSSSAPADGQVPAGGGQFSNVAPYRPEGLPDHLFGANERETLDKVFGAYKGARDSIARFGEVPKEAKDYVFEPADPVKPYAEALGKDPFFEKVKGIALAHQIPKGQFNNFINGVLSEMIAGEMVADPFNPDKERAALVPDVTDPTQRAQKADQIIRENIALLDAWKAQGLPESSHALLSSQMDRAAANQLVSWISARSGEQRPALGGALQGAITKADLDRRTADPRNNIGTSQYDRAFAAETDAMYKRFYGG